MDFHVKYRPTSLDGEGPLGVFGQDAVVESLRTLLEDESPPHAFLFTGPSGVGKTTLARICAEALGASSKSMIEVDAASNSGVESVRKLTEPLRFTAIGGGAKAVIIDECHSLSKTAWQALLKTLEEPPAHVFFMLCTTEADKVPKTIKTRCHCYELSEVEQEAIEDLISIVAEAEELPVPDKAFPILAEAAYGSPRQALVLLSMVRGESTVADVRRIISTQGLAPKQAQVVELCRALIFKPDIATCLSVIKRVQDSSNPESTRLAVVNYAAAVVLSDRKQSDRVIDQALNVIACFQGEFNQSEKWAPLLLACANATMRD